MRRTIPAAFAALLVAACSDAPPALIAPEEARSARAGAGLSFTTIDVPGSLETSPSGIGPGGDIVGSYLDAGGVTRGFLLRRGTYTTIDFPGASLTQARGIGPSGDIVGTYKLPGDPGVRWRSFLLSRNGEFRDLTFPGHESIMAQRILPDGSIVGCVHDADLMASMKGMVLSRRGNRTDEIFASMHNGATPDLRRIAGLYFDMGAGHRKGYIVEDGVFTSLQVPGGDRTEVWDMNPAGEVVGIYRFFDNGAPRIRGFLYTEAGYTTIHVPGSIHTFVSGTNAAGDIVGDFFRDGKWSGFVASRTGRPNQ